MAMAEPIEHSTGSAVGKTAWETVKGTVKGVFEGAGTGAIIGALVVGGVAVAVASALAAPTMLLVATGAVFGLGGAAAGATVGGVVGTPVGAVKGFSEGRDKVRAENLEAKLLHAREAGFEAQTATAQALQMQVAQEMHAARPQTQLATNNLQHGYMQPRAMQQQAALSGHDMSHVQREAARQAVSGQQQPQVG